MSDNMTTAELLETAREKARAAMLLIEEARQVIGSTKPSDEPTDEDNAYADRFITGTSQAYSELYRLTV